MIWGSMRCDDVQSTLPHRTTLSNYGLRVVLGKSKTSGPDKIQKEVSVHVYRTVSLTGEDWLGIGYRLWDDEPFSYRRDFLVMEPTTDWTSAKRKFVTPSGLSSLISKLLSDLPVPRKQGDVWVANTGGLLLPDGLETHFTGHSPRNSLTSVAAAIGFTRTRGHIWAAGNGYGSFRGVCPHIASGGVHHSKGSQQINVTGLDQEYFEDEAVGQTLQGRRRLWGQPQQDSEEAHGVLQSLWEILSWGNIPHLEVLPDDWFEIGENEEDELTLAANILDQKTRDEATSKEQSKFFVTISRRTAFRRLHLTGCFVKPSNCTEVRMLDEVANEDFDSICRACKRKMLAENGKDVNPESSSTASSSSTESADDVAG